MLSRIARGVPRFSMTNPWPSRSTRFRSLPKFDLARRAGIIILSFTAVLVAAMNSPIRLLELYSCKFRLSMAGGPFFRGFQGGGLLAFSFFYFYFFSGGAFAGFRLFVTRPFTF